MLVMNRNLERDNQTDQKGPESDTASAFMGDVSRWDALCARDASADGHFFYSVKSTGVYCRPSCASRRPLRANVAFHETAASAETAGFRACKRCRPSEDRASIATARSMLVERACRLIESSENLLSLDELAAASALSAAHFHRLFKSVTGVTPRSYAVAHRASRVRNALSADAGAGSGSGPGTSNAITSTYLEAGFGSSARFYSDASGLLGMTPSRYKGGGERMTIRFAIGRCSLGDVLVAATDIGVCAILIGDDPQPLVDDLQRRFPRAELIGGDEDFDLMVARVVGMVDDPRTGADLPLDVRGTAFQQRVWEALRQIPAGSTASYTDIALKLGSPQAVRAVAGACAANPVAVAIPCHRVVRSDGGLSGYRWGVDRKRALLLKESGQ